MTDGMGVVWSLVVLLAFIGLNVGAVAAAVYFVRSMNRPSSRPARPVLSALDLLERRLATGEISTEEFDDARARLRDQSWSIDSGRLSGNRP